MVDLYYMIRLEEKYLTTPTNVILEVDYNKTLGLANKVATWVKTRKAYAISANQLGLTERFFIAHRKYKKWKLPTTIYFNPTFKPINKDDIVLSPESCLSYPGRSFNIPRFLEIELSYYCPWDKELKQVVLKNLAAIICQHEIMHLNGQNETLLHIEDVDAWYKTKKEDANEK